MWIASHATQAGKPDSLRPPAISPTALPRPIVAKLPLSR